MDGTRGYVGLTDPDWYSFLSTRPRVDEVNFWQPRGGRTFRALPRGGVFFFKLRGGSKAIVGFGFFERFELLPAWLAWECFGEMNGAPDFGSLVDRIGRLRGETTPPPRDGGFKIGCVMISAPVFFAPNEWVLPPDDWARTGIQQGKTYDLASGEGRRILEECLARASAGSHYWNVDRSTQAVADGAERFGKPMLVRPRLGQGLFSLAVRDAYGGSCAVTHEHSGPVLEAAHIKPYSMGGEHRVDNGLLLRSDVHRLFDLGYVTVSPDYIFRVGDQLRDEFKNGRSYYDYDRQPIAPPRPDACPSRELLAWHGELVFKG